MEVTTTKMFFSKLWHDGRGGLIGRPSQKFLISKFCITGILMHVIVHIIKINHNFFTRFTLIRQLNAKSFNGLSPSSNPSQRNVGKTKQAETVARC